MIQAHEASKPGDWHFANFINAFCKTDNAVFEMCRDMHIALMEKDVRLYRSTLNADSSPLELCISMSANNVKYRLIGDPCPMESDAKRRMEYGKDALPSAYSLQGDRSLFTQGGDGFTLFVKRSDVACMRHKRTGNCPLFGRQLHE